MQVSPSERQFPDLKLNGKGKIFSSHFQRYSEVGRTLIIEGNEASKSRVGEGVNNPHSMSS